VFTSPHYACLLGSIFVFLFLVAYSLRILARFYNFLRKRLEQQLTADTRAVGWDQLLSIVNPIYPTRTAATNTDYKINSDYIYLQIMLHKSELENTEVTDCISGM
jgi:hypothetical protein